MKKRERIDLNITPLIDIVFILFTFFLVATSFKPKEAKLDINLPTTTNYEVHKDNKKSVKIKLSKNKILINNKLISYQKLEIEIKKIDKGKTIEIKIDENIKYKKISELLNLLKKYHINKISLITKNKNKYK